MVGVAALRPVPRLAEIQAAGLIRHASDRSRDGIERSLPVAACLRPLLPQGVLRRGGTVAVAPGSTSLIFTLLAEASAAGSWCVAVGLPDLGLVAAAEAGVAMNRFALVPSPGPDWASVVAALLDGVDIIVAAPPGPVPAQLASRLAARARQRGAVLIPVGRWPGAEITLEVTGSVWHGIGRGRGRLRRHDIEVIAHGRGAAARVRRARLWLPAETGGGRIYHSHRYQENRMNTPGRAGMPDLAGVSSTGEGSPRPSRGVRTMLLWCPDWPVIAAGITDGVNVHGPVAVLRANRVLACSPTARMEGVKRGLRRREAQGRCPDLTIVDHDPGRDARAFEPIVAAVEQFAPGVEVVRPGACALAARGPAGYYGGEAQAAERLVEHVALSCAVEGQVGVADGIFAAMLAARTGRIVPPDGTIAFLAGMDIATLERPELADLLRRLGVRTLGDFAALPAGDVMARFGFDAAYAHRLAAGGDDRPLAVRKPPPDLAVTGEYDPPLERVDMAAFAARALAERLHERLAGHGLAATRLGIEAHTAAGEELHRVWRHDGLLDASALADRVRWQLDGWLTGTGRAKVAAGLPARPTAGIDRLRLIPDGVVRQAGMQAGLWGDIGAVDERAHRALVRVQGLLGPDAVFTAVIGGGRGYADRVRLVPWGDERTPHRPGGGTGATGVSSTGATGANSPRAPRSGSTREQPPWPGRLPAPAPATVLTEPAPVQVRSADGVPLRVDARMTVAGEPATVTMSGEAPVDVVGWAGPWPVDERWWVPAEATQLIRFQLLLADDRAVLVAFRDDQWTVEAVYD